MMVRMIENTFRLGKLLPLILVFVISAMTSSCTKKNESSTLNIAMPDWSAVAEKYSANSSKNGKIGTLSGTKVTAVTRVMINISGPGMTTAVRIWDFNDAPRVANSLPLPPAEFRFEVPRGTDRLFQALAILEEVDLSSSDSDSGGGPMTFLYGDLTKSISQSTDEISIALVNQGTSNGPEGSLSGRYLSSAGVGPSGKVNMYYAPLGGRPEMIVHATSIFSGFMHLFLPPTAQFSYRMADSDYTLFEKINVNSFDSLLSTRLMKIEVPAAFRSRGSSATREPTLAKSKLVGFFGPGALTEVACYNSYSVGLTNLFVSSDLSVLTGVEWSAASGLTTDARRTGGGQPYTGDLCPGGNGEFGVGHLYMQTASLGNGDSPLGLNGPFHELAPSSNNYLAAAFNGTQLSLHWKYLRPTIGDSVDGVGVFTKVLAQGENSDLRWHDSAPCKKLTDLGFTEITRVAAGSQAAPIETYTISSIDSSAYSAGRHITALCPYSNTRGYYDFALTHSTGSSSSQLQATRMVLTRLGEPSISSSGQRTSVASGACTPMILRSTDEFGNLARRNNGAGSISITHTGGGATQFSLQSNCGGGSSTVGFNLHDSEYIFYMDVDPSATDFEVLADDASTPALTSTTFYGSRVSPMTSTQAIATAPALIYQHQCFPFSTTKASANGADRIPQGDNGAQAISYAASLAQSGLSIFEDGSCETAAGSLFFTAETLMASRKLYAQYTGALSAITLAPAVTGLTTESTTLNVLAPGQAVRTQLQIGTQVNPSTCQAVKLMSQDLQGRASPVTSTVVTEFNFSTTGVGNSGMYSDAGCTSALPSVAISTGQTKSSIFYFRWETNESIVISSGGTSTLPMYPSTVSVSP